MSYYTDARNCSAAEKPVLQRADGTEVELPYKWIVCPLCRGTGKHVNPAIDSNGLTHEDMDDPEFMQNYMDGVYDVTCNMCTGRTTVPDVDTDALHGELAEAYAEWLEQRRAEIEADMEWRAEQQAEARMLGDW